jgi:virginiamycin B lyase
VNLAGGFSADVVTGLNGPSQIVAGPDGRMWLTETGASDVFAYAYYLYSPANGLCATLTASAGPIGITSGIVGGIAFTEDTANKLAFVALSGTDFCTVVREATIPTASSHPRRIVAVGQDVWFTENGANQIGRYNYNANHFDEYPIPTPASAPLGITLGPDGNVWFTEYAGNKIGRITPAGVVTEYTIPTAGSGPSSICLGPDGALYFTENITNKIGRLRVFIQGDVNDDGVVDIADVFYTINFLFAGGPPPK